MKKLSDSVRYLPGVGEKRAAMLEKLGIKTVRDLIRHFPRDYEDRTLFCSIASLSDGQTACIRATAASDPSTSMIRKGLTVSKFRIFDETGMAQVVLFNRKYTASSVKAGAGFTFYGKVEVMDGRVTLVNPEIDPDDSKSAVTGRIMPVYSLTSGITRNILMRAISSALDEIDDIPDIIPEKYRPAEPHDLHTAYRNIHFPPSAELAAEARERLAYEELFMLCLRLHMLRGERSGERRALMTPLDLDSFLSLLPFKPTGAQLRAVREAAADMESGKTMNRLIQGDVGSGKTAVAAALIYMAAKNGSQSALMAPTELLARQHFETLSRLLSPAGIRIRLLTGSTKKSERAEICSLAASGGIDLLIGTHAILYGAVSFSDLALVITDEQHRFGVRQRAALSARGQKPHTLVLSATPIPRTLSLIIFGELDISIIDELPPGRLPVDTFIIDESKRKRMYNFIRKLVSDGGQAYIVCPSIDENDENDMKSAAQYAENLRSSVFPDISTGLLHGRMKPSDKNDAMERFARGETRILVSTTVIEVGVDVPDACIMVVENAEHFGLSTLHQLRGRVGRGSRKSYCILVSSASHGSPAYKRLSVLTQTSDGFKIAEADLAARGPGDFLGERQHGLPEMQVAPLGTDMRLLRLAEANALELLKSDPLLSHPKHSGLCKCVSKLLDDDMITMN